MGLIPLPVIDERFLGEMANRQPLFTAAWQHYLPTFMVRH
jgi:hypothetical protein